MTTDKKHWTEVNIRSDGNVQVIIELADRKVEVIFSPVGAISLGMGISACGHAALNALANKTVSPNA